MALRLAQEYIRHTTYTEPTMKTIESLPLDGANGVRIEILERSDTTLVIRWVEPGRCHYGEQRWRPSLARPAKIPLRIPHVIRELHLRSEQRRDGQTIAYHPENCPRRRPQMVGMGNGGDDPAGR